MGLDFFRRSVELVDHGEAAASPQPSARPLSPSANRTVPAPAVRTASTGWPRRRTALSADAIHASALAVRRTSSSARSGAANRTLYVITSDSSAGAATRAARIVDTAPKYMNAVGSSTAMIPAPSANADVREYERLALDTTPPLCRERHS